MDAEPVWRLEGVDSAAARDWNEFMRKWDVLVEQCWWYSAGDPWHEQLWKTHCANNREVAESFGFEVDLWDHYPRAEDCCVYQGEHECVLCKAAEGAELKAYVRYEEGQAEKRREEAKE